jgi:hypothetical protein
VRFAEGGDAKQVAEGVQGCVVCLIWCYSGGGRIRYRKVDPASNLKK